MRAPAVLAVGFGLALTLVAACGTSGDVHSTGASAVTTTAAPAPRTSAPTTSTSAVSTTVVASTERATTTPATTTVPATTTPATTAPAATGWTRGPLPPEAFAPCCDSNWVGVASPPLNAEPAPLADGVYHATRAAWSPTDPGRMLIAVDRFESCNVLPAGECTSTGPYADDEMGIDPVQRRTISVPLDGTTGVGLGGYGPEGDTATATGTQLSALMSALASSYEELIGAPLRAGTDPQQIIDDITANPRGGFTAAPPDAGALLFTFGDAPPVLFQVITDYDAGNGPYADSGTAILRLNALEVSGGQPTLHLYAGFYS